MKEEIARKYSAYFQSILHHNNGYFLTVSASLSYSEASNGRPRRNVLIAAALSEFPSPANYPTMHQEPIEGNTLASSIGAFLVVELLKLL